MVTKPFWMAATNVELTRPRRESNARCLFMLSLSRYVFTPSDFLLWAGAPPPHHLKYILQPFQERIASESTDGAVLFNKWMFSFSAVHQSAWVEGGQGGRLDGWRGGWEKALHLLPSSAVICCPTAGQRLYAFCSLVIRLSVWLPALGSPVTQLDVNQHWR